MLNMKVNLSSENKTTIGASFSNRRTIAPPENNITVGGFLRNNKLIHQQKLFSFLPLHQKVLPVTWTCHFTKELILLV